MSAPGGPTAPERTLYDVFGREKPGAPITHLGSLEAPDAELARLYACQLFSRRGEQQDLHIEARAQQQQPVPSYERVLDHHALRDGATHAARRRMAREGSQEP